MTNAEEPRPGLTGGGHQETGGPESTVSGSELLDWAQREIIEIYAPFDGPTPSVQQYLRKFTVGMYVKELIDWKSDDELVALTAELTKKDMAYQRALRLSRRLASAGLLIDFRTGQPIPDIPPEEAQKFKQEELLKRAAEDEAFRMKARAMAKTMLEDQQRGEIKAYQLNALLAEPDEQVRYRIDQWMPSGSRVTLVASQKSGKTTLTANLARSLVDGTGFLGLFHVQPVTGTFVVIDFEMSKRMLRQWYREVGIRNTDQVQVWPMRGVHRGFDILDVEVRKDIAATLRDSSAEFLVVDCLAPALTALDLTESNEDMSRFLYALDTLIVESGVQDCILVHHTGHTQERARGGSRLRGWPEVEWTLVKERDSEGNENERGPRYLKAFGRDVDVAEGMLNYNATDRSLTWAGGTRRDQRLERHMQATYDIVLGTPGIATAALKTQLQVRADVANNQTLTDIIQRACANGFIEVRPVGTAKLYFPIKSPAEADGPVGL